MCGYLRSRDKDSGHTLSVKAFESYRLTDRQRVLEIIYHAASRVVKNETLFGGS